MNPSAVKAVAESAAVLFELALADVRALDEVEHRRVLRDIEAGGRLRLVVDRVAGDPAALVRVRVRLLSASDQNRWIYGTRITARAR